MIDEPTVGVALLLPIQKTLGHFHFEGLAVLRPELLEILQFLLLDEDDAHRLGGTSWFLVSTAVMILLVKISLTTSVLEIRLLILATTLLHAFSPLYHTRVPCVLWANCDLMAFVDNHCGAEMISRTDRQQEYRVERDGEIKKDLVGRLSMRAGPTYTHTRLDLSSLAIGSQ